jgi:hypothetical protein
MLQRMSPFLALSRHLMRRSYPVAIGGEADIARTHKSIVHDPERPFAITDYRIAKDSIRATAFMEYRRGDELAIPP